MAVLSGLGLSILLNGGNELLQRFLHIRFEETDIERMLEPHGAGQFVLALAVIALFAPFVEEYFFRGLFLSWALRATGGVAGHADHRARLRAGARTSLHPSRPSGSGIHRRAVRGRVILAQWVVRTGSLRTSFAAHAAYNATAILFSVFYP
ncbi:MAG: CPBP family intramembrane glutamic endopeptidase [Rhizomicrobium sp.]